MRSLPAGGSGVVRVPLLRRTEAAGMNDPAPPLDHRREPQVQELVEEDEAHEPVRYVPVVQHRMDADQGGRAGGAGTQPEVAPGWSSGPTTPAHHECFWGAGGPQDDLGRRGQQRLEIVDMPRGGERRRFVAAGKCLQSPPGLVVPVSHDREHVVGVR